MSEQFLHYGECPKCGAMCQPEQSLDDRNIEWVVCCDCEILWNLYHDDPADRRDGEEPWRKYRIGEIETFEEFGTVPYECKET